MSDKLFDFVIGNPPYQEDAEDTSDKPVYNTIMEAAFEISDKSEFITPARFLFNAGKTPKAWNEKMLNDEHFKVLKYEQNSSKLFPSTDIKGGVAITYYDSKRKFHPIEAFTQFEELRSIKEKVEESLQSETITDLMYLQNKFNLDKLYLDYPEAKNIISSGGKKRRIVTSSFNKLKVFSEEKINDECVQILGITQPGNIRVYKWISRKYIEDNGNLEKYKVIVPKSNGSGAIGEVLSTPLIGYTQSFIGIGAFNTKSEAEACLKYIKTKFARSLLGILKITQDNPPEKWRFIPLQDFTEKSDIDWTQSIHDIDIQLYEKYDLDADEIEFIEDKVKEMD